MSTDTKPRTSLPPRARMVLIITGAIMVIMVVMGIMGQRGNTPPPAAAPGAQLQSAPGVRPIPGSSEDREYQELVREGNERALARASEEGRSFEPTLVEQAAPREDVPLWPEPQVVQPPPELPVLPPPPPQVVTPPPPPRPPRDPQAVQAARTAYAANMNQYLEGWNKVNNYQEFAYNGQRDASAVAAQAQPGQGGLGGLGTTAPVPFSGSPPIQDADVDSGATYVTAGTIAPITIITPVSSDTPGPVLAEVVAGPLAGARVMGTFTANENTVVLQFNRIALPWENRSFSIQAFAVDLEGAPGMASKVNRHYLRRFGFTAAAAFMQGWGQLVSRQNTTVIVNPDGSVVESRGELSTDQVRQAALGNVGGAIGQELAREGNIRPTVTLRGQDGQGVSAGLLFLADF